MISWGDGRRAVVPPRLQTGDEIRVLALSRSLGGIRRQAGMTAADVERAVGRLEDLGLQVSFGRHVWDCNADLTAAAEDRLADLHAALIDPHVKGLLAVSGGIGAVQLVADLDYELYATHPKVLCGYSDIGVLANAILACSGVVCYYGPNFSTFMMRQGFEPCRAWFVQCLFRAAPFLVTPAATWSDDDWAADQDARCFLPNDGYWVIQPGRAEGTVVGGSAGGLARLQGSRFFPPLHDAVVFLESPDHGKASLMSLDSQLRALSFLPGFEGVRGLVIGRYARRARIDRDGLQRVVRSCPFLAGMPVVAHADFGHTTPMMTLPIGGRCRLEAGADGVTLTLLRH